MARHSGRVIPRVVWLIIVNALMGAGVGAVVTASALSIGSLNLGHLLAASNEPWIALALLFSGMMGTFAGLSAGTAVMLAVQRRPGNRR